MVPVRVQREPVRLPQAKNVRSLVWEGAGVGMCHCSSSTFFALNLGCSSHADSLWGILQDALGSFDGVLH